MKTSAVIAAAAATTLAGTAQAHFQFLYTPEVMLAEPGDVPLAMVFGHPMENGHTMNMGEPEEFFVVFKGEKTDLKDSLEAVKWSGSGEEPSDAYTATYKVRRNGDYSVALGPAPYMEGAEDINSQQITKTILNKGAMPTGWNEPIGRPTEIVPMNKPYQTFVGGTFTGQLLSDGKPAAGIECEVEDINAEVDMEGKAFSKEPKGTVPPSAVVAITDENGMFTFGIPRAGTWGFACLGSGPVKEHEGKELSQDAVLWIHATEL
ncbi:DUF4198 domain-containing protein [Thiohalocapsa sp.]|uniref:DUF4198 domain-containing protein n=1 Tax=Thiohalocapsa sp. TaxID=2497641 RepID=UPI0025E22BA8|nr:DUF4198 domain-containing protein [Thiohalocapsa sp.]